MVDIFPFNALLVLPLLTFKTNCVGTYRYAYAHRWYLGFWRETPMTTNWRETYRGLKDEKVQK